MNGRTKKQIRKRLEELEIERRAVLAFVAKPVDERLRISQKLWLSTVFESLEGIAYSITKRRSSAEEAVSSATAQIIVKIEEGKVSATTAEDMARYVTVFVRNEATHLLGWHDKRPDTDPRKTNGRRPAFVGDIREDRAATALILDNAVDQRRNGKPLIDEPGEDHDSAQC